MGADASLPCRWLGLCGAVTRQLVPLALSSLSAPTFRAHFRANAAQHEQARDIARDEDQVRQARSRLAGKRHQAGNASDNQAGQRGAQCECGRPAIDPAEVKGGQAPCPPVPTHGLLVLACSLDVLGCGKLDTLA